MMEFDLLPSEYKSLIPAFSKPKHDELLSSWVVRLAKDHNLKVHEFCDILFPKMSVWNRDIDRANPKQLINKLSQVTLAKEKEIHECLISSYSDKLFSRLNPNGFSRWVLAQGIYHRQRLKGGLMYCPICLQKDDTPYFRKKWRISLFTVCTTCGCLLQESCPSCGSPINFFRNYIGRKVTNLEKPLCICHNCGFDLRDSKPLMSTRRFLRMQRFFERMLNGRYKDPVKSIEYFDVIYQLAKIFKGSNETSLHLRRTMENSHRLKFSQDIQGKLFELLSVEQRLPLLYTSYLIMNDFPYRFIAFCRENRIWSSTLLKDFKNPPPWFLEQVNNNLFISNVNRRKSEYHKFFSYYESSSKF